MATKTAPKRKAAPKAPAAPKAAKAAGTPAPATSNNVGRISQVIGAVVDVTFEQGHLPAILTSKNPDLLERVLFEHGALVLRWQGEVPKQIEESGAIVIADQGIEVPIDDPLEFLENAGILLRRDGFKEGEGI